MKCATLAEAATTSSPLFFPSSVSSSRCAFVVLLMSFYWLLELLPLPATALLPVFLFPVLGVLPTSAASESYFSEVNMLMLGGIIVAVAVEEVGMHRRIALRVMLAVGTGKRRLLIGTYRIDELT